MAFRLAIAASYILFVVNAAEILHIDRFNPIQKSMFLVAAIIYVATRKTDKRIIALLFVVLAMLFVLGALTTYRDFQWSTLLGGLNQVIVPYLLLAGYPTEKDRVFFLKLAVCLAPAASILGLLYGAAGILNPFPLEFSTGEARFAGTLNPAFLGGFAAIGIFASYKLMERGSKLFALGMLLNFAILILTAGRMNLLVTVLVLVPSFLFSTAVSRRTKLNVTIASVAASFVIIPVVWLRYADRLAKSGTSGRDIMWDWLFQMSRQYPDYGIGFSHAFWATPREVVIQVGSPAAHNDYLRLLVELGNFGVFAFYAMLIAATIIVWKSDRGHRDLSILFALVSFLLLSATDNALATPCYFTLILATIMAARSRTNNSRKILERPTRPLRPESRTRRVAPRSGQKTMAMQEDNS